MRTAILAVCTATVGATLGCASAQRTGATPLPDPRAPMMCGRPPMPRPPGASTAVISYEFRFFPAGSSVEEMRAAGGTGLDNPVEMLTDRTPRDVARASYDSTGAAGSLLRLRVSAEGSDYLIFTREPDGTRSGSLIRVPAGAAAELSSDAADRQRRIEQWTTKLDGKALSAADSMLTMLWEHRCAVSLRTPSSRMAFSSTDTARFRAGETLRPSQVADIAAQIHRLTVSPELLEFTVGDTLRFSEHLRVTAFDSAGRELGVLPIFDRRVLAGRFEPTPNGGLLILAEGEAALLLSYPRTFWRGRDPDAIPRATVRLRVTRRESP